MRYPVVFDCETKLTFRQVTNHSQLGITVVAAYDYRTEKLEVFEENELQKLFVLLENASMLIGFNIDGFDLPVLQPYYSGNVAQFKTFDILSDIRRLLGRRISLNDVVKATLGKEKSGHGLQAIQYYKEGKMDELKKYCSDDVILTKELFDFGCKNGTIYYPSYSSGKEKLYVNWAKMLDYHGDDDISLTLPF